MIERAKRELEKMASAETSEARKSVLREAIEKIEQIISEEVEEMYEDYERRNSHVERS